MSRVEADGKVHAGPGADPNNPPSNLPSRAGHIEQKRAVPFVQGQRSPDPTPRGNNLHIGLPYMGAHAWLKFGMLVFSPQNSRIRVVKSTVPRSEPIGGPRAVVLTNRPALQLPQYRFTGKPDQEIYSEAKARATARLATRKRR